MDTAKDKEDVLLSEAISQVDKLEELLSTVDDDQACIESQSEPILYQVNFDTNFEDRNGFVTGIARYMEEATVHAALNQLLEDGEKHAVMLYTWRCCSRGIPQPKSNDDPNRRLIHAVTIEVLTPEVEKLYSLMRFQKVAIERFCTEVKILCPVEKRKEFVSSAYLLTLGKFINMFAILDELKNIKSSVKIDFSTYRRAAQVLKLMSDPQTLQESQNLSVFLATPNKIRDNLRENLEKLQNYEDVLCDVINICVRMFEQRLYVTLDEKHMLVKVIGFCLGLVDNSRTNINKLDDKKKIKIERIDKIFKTVEVVPLYGDMQISPFNYIKGSGHYDTSKWPHCTAVTADFYTQVDLVTLLTHISQDHLKYLCQLQEHSTSSSGTEPSTEVENDRILKLALKGLQLLSEWTSAVLELHSWKLLHPTDHHQNRECPQNAEEYERATTYNYTDAEKSALVQVIGMIKGLQGALSKMESTFSDGIRLGIYLKLQTFVQVALREPLRKATKHKRNVLRSVLISIRETCAEWMAGEDPAMKGQKGTMDVCIPKRCVALSSTQMYLLQTMLESLISDKRCAKRVLRKDLDTSHVSEIEDFYRISFFWGYLLNFSEVLKKCSDLSQLWYREFYLELTMGRRIQFPIEMSLPWILIDHVLSHPSLIEFALSLLDLYNDSAYCALNMFRKQWLVDELIAEANLCFDQFVFKLSEQIFVYFKRSAAVCLLNSKFRQDWQAVAMEPISAGVKTVKYEALMQQRRVYLLGHYVDLNKLIRQRIATDFLKSLQAAVDIFDEGDLSGVIQLDGLKRLNRETHKRLKRYLPGLDDFDSLWQEANRSVTTPQGKITLHVVEELTKDFVPHYCYNGSMKRFVKTDGWVFASRIVERTPAPPVPAQYLWGTKQLNTAFSIVFNGYSGFIGEPHFRAIAGLLGYAGLALVMKELLKICERLISGPLRQWVQILKDSMLPKYIRAPNKPLNDGGTPGLLMYYMQVLSSVIQHPGVKLELFQHFREVGNAVLFCWLVEQSLAAEETWQMCQANPFQGVHPRQQQESKGHDKNAKDKMGDTEALLKALNVSLNVAQYGTERQQKLTVEENLLSGELLTFGLRIFPRILAKVREALLGVGGGRDNADKVDNEVENVWTGPPPVNHVMNMHRCGEFHRVWSALQFVSCIPVGPNECTSEQLFGDGLHWAGCLFIALLDQQRRFQTFDFSNHLWATYREDEAGGVVRGINVQQMMRRIRCIQVLNNGIFSVLSQHLNDTTSFSALDGIYASTNLSAHVQCYLPPIHKTLLPDSSNLSPEATRQLVTNLCHPQNTPENFESISNFEEQETASSWGENEELNLEEIVIEARIPSLHGDRWDDFKFWANPGNSSSSCATLKRGGEANNPKNPDDEQAAEMVDVLFQNVHDVDEIVSVSCVNEVSTSKKC